MSSLRDRAASGVFWMVLQVWLVRVTTAGAFVILSRQLQPSEFGLIALAMAVIGVLSVLSDTGMATWVMRAEAVDQRILSTAFWTTMLLSTALAALVLLLAAPASSLFGVPGLAPVLCWLSLGLVLTGLNSVPSAILRRDLRFRSFAVRGAIATVIGSVVAIVMALAGYGVWALVAQSLVRGAVSVVIIWTGCRWMPSLSWDRALIRPMISFGSQLLGVDLLNQARRQGNDFILAAMVGTTGLGLWAVANRLLRIVQETCASTISAVATPAFSKLQGDPERLRRSYAVALATSGAAIFPVLLFLAVTSRTLVPMLLGQQWSVTAGIAQILAVVAVLEAFSYFDRPVFVALDKVRTELWLVLGSTVSHLIVVVVALPFGLTVLAWSLLARAAVVVPVRFLTLRRVTGIPASTMIGPLRVLAAASVAAAASWCAFTAAAAAADVVQVLVAGLVLTLLYPFLLWLCARPVARDLLRDLARLRRRGRTAVVAETAALPADLAGSGPSALVRGQAVDVRGEPVSRP